EANGSLSALAMSVQNETGAELGCVALPGHQLSEIVATVHVSPSADRAATLAPTGAANVISDLTVIDTGSGQVGLGWTQTNAGDYDLNGEVNVADLVEIAQNYLRTYDANHPLKHNNPLYWIDGDKNGEINAADLTTIS